MKRRDLAGSLRVGDKLRLRNYTVRGFEYGGEINPTIPEIIADVIIVDKTGFSLTNPQYGMNVWPMSWNPEADNDHDKKDNTDYEIIGGLIHPTIINNPTKK